MRGNRSLSVWYEIRFELVTSCNCMWGRSLINRRKRMSLVSVTLSQLIRSRVWEIDSSYYTTKTVATANNQWIQAIRCFIAGPVLSKHSTFFLDSTLAWGLTVWFDSIREGVHPTEWYSSRPTRRNNAHKKLRLRSPLNARWSKRFSCTYFTCPPFKFWYRSLNSLCTVVRKNTRAVEQIPIPEVLGKSTARGRVLSMVLSHKSVGGRRRPV